MGVLMRLLVRLAFVLQQQFAQEVLLVLVATLTWLWWRQRRDAPGSSAATWSDSVKANTQTKKSAQQKRKELQDSACHELKQVLKEHPDPPMLDLRDFIFLKVPALPKSVQTVKLFHPKTAQLDISCLLDVPKLKTLALTGAPLTLTLLETVKKLTFLRELDLTDCRTIVDGNNSAKGFCRAEDIFSLQLSMPKLQHLKLPRNCEVEVGHIVKVFPKPSVAVIQLSNRLCVGDVLEVRHGHEPCRVQSIAHVIRTDDHRELQVARPSDSPNIIDSQVAVKLKDCGVKGDVVYWMGHDVTSLS